MGSPTSKHRNKRKLPLIFSSLLAVLAVVATITGHGSGSLISQQASSSTASAITNYGNQTNRNTEVPITAEKSSPAQSTPQAALQPGGISEAKLRISYIDVGQGDSILIQTPNGKNMLIDAGDNAAGPTVVNYLQHQGIRRLDAVIWTHPHADHIGGADNVLKSFPVGQVYMPNIPANTESYKELLANMRSQNLKPIPAKTGESVDLDPEVNALFLAPNSSHYLDTNDYSAVLRLTYGENSFLFAGDAQFTSEQEMLASGYTLKADVLKVGHHGSHSSTSQAFLSRVQPKYAVISVGKNNDYGHPHPETLVALDKAGTKIYRTDESGTIVAESDGRNIKFTTGREISP